MAVNPVLPTMKFPESAAEPQRGRVRLITSRRPNNDWAEMTVEATVIGIHRYPVKSLGGESLDSVELTGRGIAWDRALAMPNGRVAMPGQGRWAPFDAFFVLKNRGDLGTLSARIDPPGAGVDDAHTIEVLRAGTTVASVPIVGTTPRIDENDTVGAWIGNPGIGADSHNQQVFTSGVPLWDAEQAHLSIINLATVRAIGSAMGVELDPLRFRANIYIDGLAPWEELNLVGCPIRIGGATLEVFSSIERCRATSARPGTNGWDLNVPGALAGYFGHLHNGIYARLTHAGNVRPGDTLAPTGSFDHNIVLTEDPEEVATAPRFAEVMSVEHSSPNTWSLTFADPYHLLNTGDAGQYLRIHRLDDTPDWRNYTISGANDIGARITVRRESLGRFSPWVSNLRVGDRIAVTGPHGTAHIDSGATESVVVLTAGIGITPALSIAQALATAGSTRGLRIIHVDRTQDAIPHLDELSSNVRALVDGDLDIFITADTQELPFGWHRGRPSTEFIRDILGDPSNVSVFICGPTAFLTSMMETCQAHGVPRTSIYIDPFYSPPVPNLELHQPPSPGPFQVRWPDGTISSWTADSGTLLELAEAAGQQPPAGCRSGACGTCEASVSGKTFALLDTFIQPDPNRALLCSSVPVSDLDITSFS